MKLDLRPLIAGERRMAFDYELPLDTSSSDTVGYLHGVGFPSPMKVSGEITNTAGYMRAYVSLSVDYEAECARCLTPVSGSFTLDLEKTLATKDMTADIPEERLDDYQIIDDGFIDMDEHLIDQLEMEFPSRFLCKEDCLGLCQRCGRNLNEEACDCKSKEIDPRLMPLKAILEKMKLDQENEENNN